MSDKKDPEKDFDPVTQVSARSAGIYDEIARRAESSGECVFCNLRDKYIITEKDGWVLTMNLFPRSTGDLVIIPRRHIEHLQEMTKEDSSTVHALAIVGMELLEKALDIHAFYLLIREGSGTDKTVKHLHYQVMHYWKGLIDWHPQEGPMLPIEVAGKLREAFKKRGRNDGGV